MRRGLETLNITGSASEGNRCRRLCGADENRVRHHNGHNAAYMAKWDGTKWVKGSDWIEPLKSKVRLLIELAAKDYAGANAGWPKRTEPRDKSS